MSAKVKEKLSHMRKDDAKYRELIGNFKKSLELWFINGFDSDNFNGIKLSCLEILTHGLLALKLRGRTDKEFYSSVSFSSDNSEFGNLHKLINDFEWLRNAFNKQQNLNFTNKDKSSIKASKSLSHDTECREDRCVLFLKTWLTINIEDRCLSDCLQILLADKGLLESCYDKEAFLRQELYAAAFVMGLTAWESQQQTFLHQIQKILNSRDLHKRFSSQPNFCNLPAKEDISHKNMKTITAKAVTTVRKTKSLPTFKLLDLKCNETKRPRCKTYAKCNSQLLSESIPRVPQFKHKNNQTISASTPAACSRFFYDDMPSTSTSSRKSFGSNLTLNSTESTATISVSTSGSSNNSTSTKRRIHLINTDNIKIWTDQNWELRQQQRQLLQQQQASQTKTSPLRAIPATANSFNTQIIVPKQAKSISPINSLLSSLFGSSHSWFSEQSLAEQQSQCSESSLELSNQSSDASPLPAPPPVSPLQRPCPNLTVGSSVLDNFLPTCGKKLRPRHSEILFEYGISTLDYNITTSATTLPNNQDKEGYKSPSLVTSKNCQSLTRFLQMSHLSHNNTQLEKENAHFRISEAIITAIEHMKCNRLESDKQSRITEATPIATDYLAAQAQASSSSITLDFLEEEHKPYVELDDVCMETLSAEVVGLSLISKFNEKHLPKVSELKWLVSEDDTPQKLLPMPDVSSSANPDDHILPSVTRGTRYWAPPRQQIIFTDHPPPNRKVLLQKQNYRCAGCGMRVSQQYVRSFRYCTYLGKYHCTGCHRNQISATPAKILQMWDFKCYPVSVFAYRLLEQMYTYPLFYVPDLNPELYAKSKSLLIVRNKRLQLKFVKDFIRTCRFALREQSFFNAIPDYITSDIDNWSMSDFIDVHSKCLQKFIDQLIEKCAIHIHNCVLCTARGFICEHCHDDTIIYPWNSRVARCDRCGSCFHQNCWKSMSQICCRCQRIDKRHSDNNIDQL
ncbi:run domain Beclin-1-interacting and cysteine-rich domain-containing protein [Glossina fuscipes]|uniref:Run domain Beclin-1-interacting and cysteine-rich domain-containing protein n=1 Tax=Glossina fuscipes TaxID=7396 RepID=A0A9C5Z4E4_9MUSC|nr:run domain Beclin-1-interacting and cysteine-rich domain-containing protein [Glossina fuscipes]